MEKKNNIKGNDTPSPESKQRNQRHRRRIRSHLSLFGPFRDRRFLYPHRRLGSPLLQLWPRHSPLQQSRLFYFYSYSYSFMVQSVKLDEVRVRVGFVTAGPSQGIKVLGRWFSLGRLWRGGRWRLITPQLGSCWSPLLHLKTKS